MGLAPLKTKKLSAMEITAKELTSPGRRSEADRANGFMTVGEQSQEDVFSSIADLLAPKRWTQVGFWNVRTLFQSGRLAQAIHEMNNYNVAIMGIAEA